MAYVAVDKNGSEVRFTHCPVRLEDEWIFCEDFEDDIAENLLKGSTKKLIGRELTWEDEPVELKDALNEKETL